MIPSKRELTLLPESTAHRYRVPQEFKRDEQSSLVDDREFPNINSLDYAKRPINRQLKQHPAWEAIARNENGIVTIATNKMDGRHFFSTFWGYDQATDFSPEQAIFKTPRRYIATNLEFCNVNNLLITYNSGAVELATIDVKINNNTSNQNSNDAEALEDHQSTMLLSTSSNVVLHDHPIMCLEVMKCNKNLFMTGDKNGGIKVSAITENSMETLNYWEFAHLHSTKAISSSTTNESLFASCSLDKSVLLWDLREVRPAIALIEDHGVRFTSLFWNDENLVYAGDESGSIHSLDIRQPKQSEEIKKISHRPFHRLIPNGSGNLVAVIANTNVFKVFDVKNRSIIYENKEAGHFLRDGVWLTDNEFLVTSFENKAYHHKVTK